MKGINSCIDKIDILPEGWLKEFLILQKKGLTGNMHLTAEPFISFSWDKYDIEKLATTDKEWLWVPFEQTAYLIDGMVKCGHLLKDKELIKKTDDIIYNVINNKDDDGYLGPKFLKDIGLCNRWPHVVFFRAMLAKYYENHDKKIINALLDHYLNCIVDYHTGRNVINIEIMVLLYLETKNKDILDLAIKTYDDYQNDVNKDKLYCSVNTLASVMLSKKKPYEHAVTYNEIIKLGALLYIATNDKKYLDPSINAYNKIIKYHLLPDGLHSSNEFLRGNDACQTHEACNISDFTHGLYYMLYATCDGKYADLIERCIYNAGIGQVLEDFTGFQYFSGPNQIICDKTSNYNFYRRGTDWQSYKPAHDTQCCAGNINRFFPYFVDNCFMVKNDDIIANFYGDVRANISLDNQNVEIIEKTFYPFDEHINFSFKCDKPFAFKIRIPTYASSYKILLNNKEISTKKYKNFIKLSVKNDDIIDICFDFDIKINEYKDDGIIVNRGPLLYSLGQKGNRIPYQSHDVISDRFKSYDIYPDKDYNYGINIKNANPQFIKLDNNGYPWDIDNCRYGIYVDAYKLDDFKMIRRKKVISYLSEDKKNKQILKGNFHFTPLIKKQFINKNNDKERIMLVPYGLAKIRLSIFPKVIFR